MTIMISAVIGRRAVNQEGWMQTFDNTASPLTYSRRRFADQSGDGLAAIALRLLVASASLMSVALLDLCEALSTCFRFSFVLRQSLVVRELHDFAVQVVRDYLNQAGRH